MILDGSCHANAFEQALLERYKFGPKMKDFSENDCFGAVHEEGSENYFVFYSNLRVDCGTRAFVDKAGNSLPGAEVILKHAKEKSARYAARSTYTSDPILGKEEPGQVQGE